MDWAGWIWNDLPTGVAIVGMLVYMAAMFALAWWVSHHYVRSAATCWQWTTWDKAWEAELRAAGRERIHERKGEAVDQLDWQEVT